jgi:hypothetical protein
VRVATTANITLNGLQSIDGVTVAADDRVLVKDQTAGAENGIYDASSGNWNRADDFSVNGHVVEGTRVYVNQGTANANTEWAVTTDDDITLDTTSIVFANVTLAAVPSILASQAEAEAGTVNTKLMSPLRTAQALAGGQLPVSATTLTGSKAFTLSGIISPTQITANQNNYNPTSLADAAVLRLATDASRTITGLAGGASGRIITIYNVGSFNIALADESASSTDANRFAIVGNATIAPDQSATLQYDATSARWRLKSIGAASSDNVFRPLAYGAAEDGVTNDTTALQALATAVRAAGGGTIEFGIDKDYLISSTPAILFNFDGCEGLKINFNGSRLLFSGTYTGGTITWVIYLTNTYDVEINGFYGEQTTTLSASDGLNGIVGIYANGTNRDLRVNGFYQKYGRACFECVRTTELSLANRTRGLDFNGLIADEAFYGFTLQKNGDDAHIDCKGINNARVFDAYNVRQIDARIESIPGTNTLNDVLFGVYAASAEAAISNTLSDVRIEYICRSQTDACDSFGGVFIRQGDASTAAGHIRNVDVKFDIEIESAALTSTAFELFKLDSAGGSDTTTRSHVVENLTLHGSLKSFANNIHVLQFGQIGTWSGDTVRNIKFGPLTSTGSGTGDFQFNATGFGSTVFDGVRFAHDLDFTNDSGLIEFLPNCSFANNSAFTQLGAAGQIRQSNGAGNAPVYVKNFRVLANSYAAVSHTGDTNETTLATVSIPAGAMGANGVLRITAFYSVTNNANNKTPIVKFGGTGGTAYFSRIEASIAAIRFTTYIGNRNSASSQVGGVAPTGGGDSTTTSALTTSAVNTANAVDLLFRGTLANSADTITLEGYTVEILTAA